ncbi:MAG: hypothetical protein V1887_03385 [Candidatus Aenigmatarchaeota archaeon]
MEDVLRKVVGLFEADSGLKVHKLVDFHVPFFSEKDLTIEVAIKGDKKNVFIRFTEDGKLLDWGWIIPSGHAQ